jgi:hypothetical protein
LIYKTIFTKINHRSCSQHLNKMCIIFNINYLLSQLFRTAGVKNSAKTHRLYWPLSGPIKQG